MSWITEPDGSIVYGKRKTLGIKVWLSPEGEDADGVMHYSVWMAGKLSRRVPFKMNGEIAVHSERIAKMKAEVFAFDPIAIAKCHGMIDAFHKCPRCGKVQKVRVLLSTDEEESDVLECTFCAIKFKGD